MNSDYHPFPNTHWSLVHRAAGESEDARRAALAVLLNRYEPALRSYLRLVRRIPEAAADDLLQSFIVDKLLEQQLLQSANVQRGRFRSFLLTSLNNFVASHYRAAAKEPAGALEEGVTTDARVLPADAQVEVAWAKALVHDVLEAMRQECVQSGRMDVWGVFEQRVLAEVFENQTPAPYEALAERLHLRSPTQAANLLVTGKRMYARLLRVAVGEYELGEEAVDEEIKELWTILSRQSPSGE